MASPNISLLGATYSGVEGVTLPKSGGGTATFPWVEGSQTVTTNATYDVTNLASLIVNVAGGGGGWTKVGNTTEITTSTTSTTAASAGTIALGSSYYTKNKIIYVRVRDKAGKRAGYFYGADSFFMNYYNANGGGQTVTAPAICVYRYTTSNVYAANASQYGVYGYSINSSGTLTIRQRYSSSYSLTINGTYTIDVYAIDPPLALFA